MSRITLKSQAIVIAQLEAQVAELTTTKGLLMNEVDSFKNQLAYSQDETAQQARIADDYDAQLTEALSQLEIAAPVQDVSPNNVDLLHEQIALQVDEINTLNADNARLAQSNTAAHNRCDVLEELLVQALDSRPVVKSAPRMTVAPDVIQSQPTVEITAQDRAFYAKFKALPRDERLAIIEFARPIVGHVGIHNIMTVRAAWRESQAA